MERYLLINILIQAWTFSTGECACELASRITHHDDGINITFNTNPCELSLKSTSVKQVVASFYDLTPDCAGRDAKGNIEIYDGQNRTLIITSCKRFGRNVSYASRKHVLTVRLLQPYKPFKINVYSIATSTNYTQPSGKVKSERFPGWISGSKAMTTPNNIQTVYNILADENVTMNIYFKEFNLHSGLQDFVRINGGNQSIDLFSTPANTLPPNVTTITDKLSIELQTDNHTTYTGFEAGYDACFDKRQDSNATEDFRFPMYQLADKMKCFLEIQLRIKRRILINMTIYSDMTDRKCKDIIRIITDNDTAKDVDLSDCKLNTAIDLDLTSNSGVKLQFTSESQTEFVTGTYKTEEIHEETTISKSGGPHSSGIFTTDISISGNQTSSENNLYTDNDQQRTQETQGIDTTVKIIAAVAAISVIIIIVIVILVVIRLRKADTTYQQKSTVQNQQNNSKVKYEPNKEEGDIYVGNEDYDVVGKKREHKMSPKENDNIYGRTNESSDQYAVVDRMQHIQKSQPSNDYGDHSFENVYDETKRHSDKERNENFYE